MWTMYPVVSEALTVHESFVPGLGMFQPLLFSFGFNMVGGIPKMGGHNNSSDILLIELLFFLFTICYVRHQTYQAGLADFVD